MISALLGTWYLKKTKSDIVPYPRDWHAHSAPLKGVRVTRLPMPVAGVVEELDHALAGNAAAAYSSSDRQCTHATNLVLARSNNDCARACIQLYQASLRHEISKCRGAGIVYRCTPEVGGESWWRVPTVPLRSACGRMVFRHQIPD